MEDDLFSAETRRIPADVVKAVIAAAEERGSSPPPVAAPRSPPSGTRRRVSQDEIASYLASRLGSAPIVDSYAPERVEDIIEVTETAPEVELPSPPSSRTPAAARGRVPLAPIPLAVFPAGAYPAPRIASKPRTPLVEQPVAVFFMAMGAVIVVLLPLVYLLLR